MLPRLSCGCPDFNDTYQGVCWGRHGTLPAITFPMELTNTPTLAFELRVENRQRLISMKREIEKQIEGDTDAIKNELAALGVDDLDVGDYTVTLQIRDRSTLDKGELVALGVSTDVIKRATKVSTYMQLDVRAKKS